MIRDIAERESVPVIQDGVPVEFGYLEPRYRSGHMGRARIFMGSPLVKGGREGDLFDALLLPGTALRYSHTDVVAKVFKRDVRPAISFEDWYAIGTRAFLHSGRTALPMYIGEGRVGYERFLLQERIDGERLDEVWEQNTIGDSLRFKLLSLGVGMALAIEEVTEGSFLLHGFSHDDVILKTHKGKISYPVFVDPPVTSKKIAEGMGQQPIDRFVNIIIEAAFPSRYEVEVAINAFVDTGERNVYDELCDRERVQDSNLREYLFTLLSDYYQLDADLRKVYLNKKNWDLRGMVGELLKAVTNENFMRFTRKELREQDGE